MPAPQIQMSDTVDDDVKALFEAIYAFIEKYGYTNANVSGFVQPNGVSLTVAAAKPDGSSYNYNQFVPNTPAPGAAPAPAASEVHR